MKGKGKRRDVSAYLDYCASRVDPADAGGLVGTAWDGLGRVGTLGSLGKTMGKPWKSHGKARSDT